MRLRICLRRRGLIRPPAWSASGLHEETALKAAAPRKGSPGWESLALRHLRPLACLTPRQASLEEKGERRSDRQATCYPVRDVDGGYSHQPHKEQIQSEYNSAHHLKYWMGTGETRNLVGSEARVTPSWVRIPPHPPLWKRTGYTRNLSRKQARVKPSRVGIPALPPSSRSSAAEQALDKRLAAGAIPAVTTTLLP